MSLHNLWTSLPPDLQTFLLGASAELTAGLLERALVALGAAVRGTPQERALRAAYTQAGVAFLSCLDLPEDLQERRALLTHIQDLLTPVFANERVQMTLTDAVLHESDPEAVDPAPIQATWAERYGVDGESTLPWHEGLGLPDAVRAFALAFEHEAESHPDLHTFLIAARLKRLVDQQEQGVRVEGMDALLQTLERLAAQQDRLVAFFTDLARLGYNVRTVSVGRDVPSSVIITGDNNQVTLPDGGNLAHFFGRLPNREQLLTEYRAHIRRANATLNLRGLALPEIHGHPLDPALVCIPLDRVYIQLRAIPREHHPKAPSPPDDPRAMARYLRVQQQRWERKRGERAVPPEEAVRTHPRLVILGLPGAGKSTFLRHLAWAEAESGVALPLLVPLGQADVVMTAGRSLLDATLDLLVTHKAGAERDTLREALAREVNAKRVLWLWDGLDEVRQHRQQVVDGLARLAADGHRMVVTSRPLGFEPIPACDALYEVLPLQQEDARVFVDRWFGALATTQGVEEAEQATWVGERARWLRVQLDDRPGLQEVAQNPLLLTFLAILAGDQPHHDLPRRRKDLYALYVERLITAWETRRRGGETIPLLDGFTDPHEARVVVLWSFGRIALHLHRAYGERPEEATRPATSGALAADLRSEMKLGRLKAQGQAEAVLAFWERAGLLDRYPVRGREWLVFRHLTFQEYGAARALAEEHTNAPDGLWAELAPHLLEDHWSPVIPLTIAHLGEATPLLERLLEANAEDEDRQRPLFRAAAALAEGSIGNEALRRQIVDDLEHQIRTRPLWEMILGTGSSLSGALVALGRLEGNSYAAARLEVLVRACGEIEFLLRVEAIGALRRLGQIDILSRLAHDSTLGPVLCMEAAEALSHLGRTDEAASVLLPLAQNISLHEGVRYRAVQDLVELGRVGEVRPILSNLIHSSEVLPKIRVAAARTVGELGYINEATSTLLPLIRDSTTDSEARKEAVATLGKLDQIDDLLALAQDETVDVEIRAAAAKALGERGWTEVSISVLLEVALDGSVDAEVRRQAAEIMCRLGQTDDAIPILQTLARDDTVDAVIRHLAAWNLSQVGRADDAVRVWLALVQNGTVSMNTRQGAISALGHLGRINELLTLARDNTILPEVREQAIWGLGQLEQFDDLRSLTCDRGMIPHIRLKSAVTLGRMGLTDETVPYLLDLIYDETIDLLVHLNAVNALGEIGKVDELSSLAHDEQMIPSARIVAAAHLGQLGQTSEAISILLTLAQDDETAPWDRVRATEALVLCGQGDVAAPILLALASDEGQDERLRLDAIKALCEIDRAALIPEALAGLRALAESDVGSEEIRRIAWLTLQQMESQENSE